MVVEAILGLSRKGGESDYLIGKEGTIENIQSIEKKSV